MNITIDKQLKKLRKERDITQESLAKHLGITVQAVSKWERGEGFPDITLLPSIASFFDVSVDDILGVGEIEKKRKIEEYSKKNVELWNQGKTKERVKLLREAQREFPNELGVLSDLMYALDSYDSVANADEVIELAERILDESTDDSLRSGAIQMLAFTHYFVKHDAETARKYGVMMNFCHYSGNNDTLPRFYEGDEAVRLCQKNLINIFEMIHRNVEIIVWKGNYSPEDAIKVYTFALDCFNLLYSDGNAGFYHLRIAEIYGNIARLYKTLGDTDKMFEALEKSVEHTIKYDTRADGMYTSFMVNKVESIRDDVFKDHEENNSALMLNDLNDNYSEFEGDKRMAELKEMLSQHAVFPK